MSHSPGPWIPAVYINIHDGELGSVFVASEGSTHRWVVSVSGETMGIPLDEVIANAALVGACPTMLAALRVALDRLPADDPAHQEVARAISLATTPPKKLVDEIERARTESAQKTEERERAEYERLRAKFEAKGRA